MAQYTIELSDDVIIELFGHKNLLGPTEMHAHDHILRMLKGIILDLPRYRMLNDRAIRMLRKQAHDVAVKMTKPGESDELERCADRIMKFWLDD